MNFRKDVICKNCKYYKPLKVISDVEIVFSFGECRNLFCDHYLHIVSELHDCRDWSEVEDEEDSIN